MSSKKTPGMTGTRATKEERRTAAREKARLLKEAEEKRAKRNKMIGVIVGLLVVVAIVFALFQVFSKSEATSKYDGEARPLELANVEEDYSINLGADGTAGQTVEGAPLVTIGSDYMCPGCQQLDLQYHDTYVKFAEEGSVGFALLPVATQGQNLSFNGAASLFYIATYSPEHTWDMNYRIMQAGFDATSGGTQAGPDQLADIAAEIGVPEDVVKDLPATIQSDEWRAYVEEATTHFGDVRGLDYTPSVLVEGELTNAWLNNQMELMLTTVAEGGDLAPLEPDPSEAP